MKRLVIILSLALVMIAPQAFAQNKAGMKPQVMNKSAVVEKDKSSINRPARVDRAIDNQTPQINKVENNSGQAINRPARVDRTIDNQTPQINKVENNRGQAINRPQVDKQERNKKALVKKSVQGAKPIKDFKQTHEAKPEKLDGVIKKEDITTDEVAESDMRLRYAAEAKEEAQRVFDALLEKQKQEMAKLQSWHAREAANGMTEEMRQRHEREVQELSARQAAELMEAQRVLDQAMIEYETALEIHDAAHRLRR